MKNPEASAVKRTKRIEGDVSGRYVGEGEQGQGHCGRNRPARRPHRNRTAEFAGRADGGGQRGVAAAKGTSALKRYSRHNRLMDRWDAFLRKLGNSDQ